MNYINNNINNNIKYYIKYNVCNYNQGFTLIELLVSMVVTLIVGTGVMVLFANTILSTNTLNSATALNEAGNRANMMLARHLRMTGYVDWLSNQLLYESTIEDSNADLYNLQNPTGAANLPSVFQTAFASIASTTPANIPMPLSGCDGVYSTLASFTATACGTATAGVSSLTVAYQAMSAPNNGFAPSLRNAFSNTAGMGGDCNNQQPTGVLYAVSRFYLKASVPTDALAGEPILYDLMCLGNGNTTPQPLANNIEQWVITYGLPATVSGVSASNDLQVTRYLTATEVTAAGAWNQVIAVRSCILVAGTRNSATFAQGTSIVNNRLDCLGNPMRVGAEHRLRQAFNQTINVRNQVHTAT